MVANRGRTAFWARPMLVLVVLLVLPGCSGSVPAADSNISVTIRDFRIVPSVSTVGRGTVAFHVQDQGPSTHEFVVVRTSLPANGLPLRPDGLTVDEESSFIQDVGEISDLNIGDSSTLLLHLRPGRYVLFCNLEGHYLGGMHALIQIGRGTGATA